MTDFIQQEPPPMTPERWRIVDAILQAALATEPDRRDAFVRDACGDDEALRREVASLLSANDAMAGDFLERPAAEVLGGAAPPPAPNERRALLAGALAGRYIIERELARGGMSTVFLARDVRHDRRVAIKVMRDEVAAVVGAERFLEEIRVTALLQHPHILPLFDSGSVGSLLWYVMPFVDGETLRSRLAREKRLPVDEAVRISREVADALAHAHARGIVHRDIKPENVLLQGGHAVVADFGIALALEHAGGERLTKTGLTLGTPQYMAPEQASGERALDGRVDVYALGAVLHEMLAGEPPFAAESRQAVVQRMLLEPPASLATKRADVSPSLDSAVRRAMAKRPDDRFTSAAAFATALTAPSDPLHAAPLLALGAPKKRSSDAVDAPSPAKMVRRRVAVLAAIGGLVIGLAGGWGIAHAWVATHPTADASPIIQPSGAVANVGDGDDGADASDASGDGLSLVVVDRAGRIQRRIPASRPWTPRFSPDGRRVAYGAYSSGRNSSDLWVTDLDAGKTQRLTDDNADSNDPQWSADGSSLAYSVGANGGKDVATARIGGSSRVIAARPGTQFPSDWLRDGSALIVTEEQGGTHDILIQPTNGSPAWPYLATSADETAARVSPNEQWIAYTSNVSGREEVYIDSYPRPGRRVMASRGGGIHPVWRADGRELYYWRNDTLVAVQVGVADGSIGGETTLFRAPYQSAPNTMYDASPDGQRFVIVKHR
ncbi:MAG TPA: protein kinase [Gemmatimonadaceae bacterium]